MHSLSYVAVVPKNVKYQIHVDLPLLVFEEA